MATANSTTKIVPWLHQSSGLWCVTRKGRRYYLGATEAEANQRATRYQKSIAQGLRIPELGQDPDGDHDTAPTVKNVLLAFLAAQKRRVDSKDLTSRSLSQYARTCRDFGGFVGDDVWIAELTPDHFARFRSNVAGRRNLISTGNEVTRVKTIFKWAYENDIIEKPVRFGTDFKRPKKRDVRIHKTRRGAKTFTTTEIKMLLCEFGVHERAMCFLGINCGFGNTDCSELKLVGEVNFEAGELCAIRHKTGEMRVATLWPETLEALKLSQWCRHEPKTEAAQDRFFVTFDGDVCVREDTSKAISNMVTQRTTAVLQRLKLHEPGKSFYWLRHTFRTIADETGDETAIKWVMGHCDDRIDKTYIHNAPRERIKRVTDHVRTWLFGSVVSQ